MSDPDMEHQADAWQPWLVLPNTSMGHAPGTAEPLSIEGPGIALIGREDARLMALCEAHPPLGTFLDRFTDAFDSELEPALIIVRRNAPDTVRSTEALAGFRDLVSLSVVPYARSWLLVYGRASGVDTFFSDSFDLYPWMFNPENDTLILQTPATVGIHDPDLFRGQSSATLSPVQIRDISIDRPLLAALLERWQRRHQPEAGWPELALFRSLNMANQACRMPAGRDLTDYDVGRSIALWVSAFEILVHPGGNGEADRNAVLRCLDAVPFVTDAMTNRRMEWTEVNRRGVRHTSRETIPRWLYRHLHNARNAFLHGNPLEERHLLLPVSGRPVAQFAAPLYRLALTAFLQLRFVAPIPDASAEIGSRIASPIVFEEAQCRYERALLRAAEPETPGP